MAAGPYTPPTTCLESLSAVARSTPIISNHVAVHPVIWHVDKTATIVAASLESIITHAPGIEITIYDMAWGNIADVILQLTQNADFIVESSNDATNIFVEEYRIPCYTGVNWITKVIKGRYCRLKIDNYGASSNTYRLGLKFRAV